MSYWMLGGTWGLGLEGTYSATGVRVVAAVVVLLLVAAVLVVLARVGLWQQAIVSDGVIRFFTWALAAVFLVETVAAFTWSKGESESWLYGPVSLVLGLLALTGHTGRWPRTDALKRGGDSTCLLCSQSRSIGSRFGAKLLSSTDA